MVHRTENLRKKQAPTQGNLLRDIDKKTVRTEVILICLDMLSFYKETKWFEIY